MEPLTYINVIKKWHNKGIYFAIEEMTELIKQLIKFLEGRGNIEKITEEMVDVEIQLNILKKLFNNEQKIRELKPSQIQRLQDVLDSQEDIKMLKRSIEPQNKIKTIVLIGSAEFKDKFLEIEKEFTFQYNLVLMPFWDGMENKKEYSNEEWEFVLGYSYKKIDLADLVYVINVGGMIGDQTRAEIEYAKKVRKPIKYLERFGKTIL